jgi:hypothetical protein
MLKFLKTLSKKDKKQELVSGNLYCVLKGTYSGEYFAFVEKKDDKYMFISLPDKQIREVSQESLNVGIEGGVLDFVERLPKKVYEVVEKEYFLINNKTNGYSNSKKNIEPN